MSETKTAGSRQIYSYLGSMKSIDPRQESMNKLERIITDLENTLSNVKGTPTIRI